MQRIFPRLLLCAAASAAAMDPLANWADFDAWAADARDCSRFSGALYPPGMARAGEALGVVPFDGTALSALLALPDEPLLGPVRARRVFLEESADSPTSRVWIVRASDGTVVRTLAPPASYDPPAWIEDEYGDPPVWLAGDALASWQAARAPSRIVPFALLVAASDLPDYRAALTAAASTNHLANPGDPRPPADTNVVAFAAFSMGADGVPSGWIWSPWPDRAHAVFRKETLNAPLWTPAFALVPGGALAAWADAEPEAPPLRSAPASFGSSGFYAAAEVETDTDDDGLPDGMELLAHGSSPFLSDSDGDGLSDSDEIGVYGSSPAVADSNDDGISDGIAVRKLLDPVSGDADGDGLSDADEILLCMTDPRKADTDRDGAVTPADRDARDRWTPSRGALLAPDAAPDSVDAYRPTVGRPLSPLVVRSTGVPLPEGWSMRLQSSVSSGTGTRLSREGHSGWVSLYNWTTNGLGDLAADDASFLLSHTNPAGADAAETTVTLSLCHGGQTLGTDTVSLRHAPLIVPWNTLPLKRLYTAGSVGGLRFPPEVEPAKQRCFPSRGVQWVQDMMQMTVIQLEDGAGGTPVTVDLERPDENEFVDLLPAGVGAAYGEFLGYVWCDNHGDGGNVEATPPLPGYPFGRLLTGVGRRNGTQSCAAVRMLERQGLQGPAITVPVGWLAVGHVDEVCCFVDDRTVLVPSPRLAFDLIAEQVRLHHGNYTDTFVWGLETNNYIHCMQDVLFPIVISSNWTHSVLSDSANSFVSSFQDFAVGDYLFCDSELMMVEDVNPVGDNLEVFIVRGLGETEASLHSGNSPLCFLSNIAVINSIDMTDGSPLERIETIRQSLRQEIEGIQFLDVPVLFMPIPPNRFVAGSANMVNAIVSGNTVYMTDPGCNLFRDAVQLSGKRFVGGTNSWELYHCLMGELHCGSEAERVFPPDRPFWKERVFLNWPFERKGTTP